MPPGAGNRPKEVHTKHLTELERFRVRTLYYDAGMSKKRIEEVTGYSNSQIRTAIRAKSAAIPHRTGRPRKQRFGQTAASADQQADSEAGPSQDADGEGDSSMAEDGSYISADPVVAPETVLQVDSHQQQQQLPQLQRQLPQLQHQPQYQPQHHQQQRKPPTPQASFNHLPPSLRQYIWTLVLLPPSPPSPSSTPSIPNPNQPLTWYINPLPHPPYLQAAVFPDHWTPHWKTYARTRLAPARALCLVNREARRVVADTFAAVWSDAAASAGQVMTTTTTTTTTPFVWVDIRRDDFYCEDPAVVQTEYLRVLLDRSRGAVLPARFLGGVTQQQQQQQMAFVGVSPGVVGRRTMTTTTTGAAGGFVRNGGRT